MFSPSDTIVAIATPPGRGGIGVVRISGPDAPRIAAGLVGWKKPFQPRYATFSRLSGNGEGTPGDEVVITLFPERASYTGEDVVEVSAHGSPVVLSGIVRRAIDGGARLAEPGEFTLRAFLNGKRDLVQAEAVADLIAAVTPLQARAAFDQLEGTLTGVIASIERDLFDLRARLEASLDFPDEGYHFVEPADVTAALDGVVDRIDRLLADAARGRLVREGAHVVIAGAPNVGKSSLFNALLNVNRAIVTPVAGTTRDMLSEQADLGGLPVALVDTAGIRDSEDVIEREGMARARAALDVADLVLVVLDRSRCFGADDERVLDAVEGRARLVVFNKVDLPPAHDDAPSRFGDERPVFVSVRTGEGLDILVTRATETLFGRDSWRDPPAVTNVRHRILLEQTRATLQHARDALRSTVDLPEEFLLQDLQDAAESLQEITGRKTTDDLLRHIFERFCIGK
jgi:tRNA modification GTPase